MDPTLSGAGASSPSRGVHPRRALRDLLTDLDSRGIHATPRAVATALWSFASANGGAWPSQVRLARMTGRCVRTVGSAVRELEAAGVIARQVPPLRMRRARHATTVYRLLAGDAPPFVPSVPPSVPPSPELVDVTDRLAALVARPIATEAAPELVDVSPVEPPADVPELVDVTEAVAPSPPALPGLVAVDQSPADAEPPLVEFLTGLLVAVDLDGVPELVDAVRPGAHHIETSTGMGFAAEDSAELPSPDLDGVPPCEPPDDGTEAAPITGNPCRTRETSNTPTAELRAHATTAAAPVDRPPRRRPPPPPTPRRGCPVRAFVVPPAVSTLSTPTAGVAGAPARSPPPALAAAAARCAALTRRR